MSVALAGDHKLAHSLAGSVGGRLLELRDGYFSGGVGGGRGDPRWYMRLDSEGDRLAHNLVLEELSLTNGSDAVLSEEGRDDPRRLDSERLWVIDPLDGSFNFAHGSDEWAVHVGLAIDGEAVAGAVSLPAVDLVFSTGDGGDGGGGVAQSDLNSESISNPNFGLDANSSPSNPIRVVTGRSHFYHIGQLLADELGAEVFACGSAGVKAMLVVQGHVDAYVHASVLNEWDVCAPAAVAASAGLHVSDFFGKPLRFNQPRPAVDGFLVCRPELTDQIIAALQD